MRVCLRTSGLGECPNDVSNKALYFNKALCFLSIDLFFVFLDRTNIKTVWFIYSVSLLTMSQKQPFSWLRKSGLPDHMNKLAKFFNNTLFFFVVAFCFLCFFAALMTVSVSLRPRLHGAGLARSRYQIEYFQDECGS